MRSLSGHGRFPNHLCEALQAWQTEPTCSATGVPRSAWPVAVAPSGSPPPPPSSMNASCRRSVVAPALLIAEVYVAFNIIWNICVLLSVKYTGALATFVALKATAFAASRSSPQLVVLNSIAPAARRAETLRPLSRPPASGTSVLRHGLRPPTFDPHKLAPGPSLLLAAYY